ncbi:hypothetical protein [Ferroplasma sp.]|uniref:hypothetical protein n=1 Tax=Ferroplasma sp. TaxID=2591003 RepID=UPI00307CE382
MIFNFGKVDPRKNIHNFKRATVKRMKYNASHFIYFMTGIRTFIMPGYFFNHMISSSNEMMADFGDKTPDSSEYLDLLELNAMYQYALLIYRKRHVNPNKINFLTGIFSEERKMYRLLADFLIQPIVNAFPFAVAATFDYYQNFSPGKQFEYTLIKYIEKTEIDSDEGSRFFMEILTSAENSAKWKRRMAALAHELYVDNKTYHKLFAIFTVYILYRINNHDMSKTLVDLYNKRPIEISKELYKNREKIEDYLALISLKVDQ